ncbi:aminoglycoside phosphotransferase family protein [Kribbella solani]|uniref:phosphotransferase family protein n=1 Tax=Kribbella solani TaxID=236067 RepID=UPI0029B91C70|nr:aminoglycoside phosphotransferase family protein [Kribbella solani]MDX3001491.1 aminoglycoside phosphotransferase family protein [Kribbella solani]
MDVRQLVRDATGLEVGEVVERTGGQLSSVYEVNTSADSLIVKVYAPDWRWKQSKEVHVYGLLAHALHQAIPKVVHVADGITILTKLDGVPLSELDPPDWRAVYAQLGALLKRIHTIEQPEYGYLTDRILDPLPDNTQYMRRQFTKKLDEFNQLGGDRSLGIKIAEHVDRHQQVFADNTAASLCHNDFHEGNILVDPQTWRVSGFIDVENAIAADPLIDVAKTIQYSVRGNRAKLDGLADGYGPTPTDRIDLYRLYHSLELWDWFSSIGETTHLDSIAKDMADLVAR